MQADLDLRITSGAPLPLRLAAWRRLWAALLTPESEPVSVAISAPVASKPRVPQTRKPGQTHSVEARRRRVVQGRKGRQS